MPNEFGLIGARGAERRSMASFSFPKPLDLQKWSRISQLEFL